MKNIAGMNRYEILDALLADGYDLESALDAADVAAAIQHAARRDALLWTRSHIITTSTPRIETVGRIVRLA